MCEISKQKEVVNINMITGCVCVYTYVYIYIQIKCEYIDIGICLYI